MVLIEEDYLVKECSYLDYFTKKGLQLEHVSSHMLQFITLLLCFSSLMLPKIGSKTKQKVSILK